MGRIRVLHGDEPSSDLYRKDVYNPNEDEELREEAVAAEDKPKRKKKNAPVEGQEVMTVQEEIPAPAEVSAPEIAPEVTDELPDFLKGENIEIISE